MLTDRYGLPVSTASAAARDAYVEGVDLLLAANYGPAEAFQRALEADPGCMLAHLGKARALQMRGDMAGARAALADAQGIAVPLTPREQSQRAVFALLIAGRPEPALEATRRHLADFPRDAVVLNETAIYAHKMGRFDEAAELFGMARSLYPDDATLAYNEAVFTEQFSKKQIEDKWTRVQQLTQPPVAE